MSLPPALADVATMVLGVPHVAKYSNVLAL